ncbi:MAG: hypothetical protein PHH84_08065 [Oscillospiraceae bacterium]|nr:hypothetical protein [Oscillospiraceae bacterium]
MQKVKLLYFLASFIILFLFTDRPIAAQINIKSNDLLSFDTADWVSLDAAMGHQRSQATIRLSDGALIFDNTNGLWPGMEYNIKDGHCFNVERDLLTYDFTPGKRTRICILFYDRAGIKQIVNISPAVEGVIIEEGEICPTNIPVSGELSLKGLENLPAGGGPTKNINEYTDENGNIQIAGVRIYIITSLEGTVQMRRLAIYAADNKTTTQSSSSPITASLSTATKDSSDVTADFTTSDSLATQTAIAPKSVTAKQTASSSRATSIQETLSAQTTQSGALVSACLLSKSDDLPLEKPSELFINTGSSGILNRVADKYLPFILLILSIALIVFTIYSYRKSY